MVLKWGIFNEVAIYKLNGFEVNVSEHYRGPLAHCVPCSGLGDDVTSQTQMSRARDCWHCHRACLAPSAATKQMIQKPQGKTF